MKLTQAIKLALKSLLSNKVRSFLTMLGIIIGITSVIVLIALGDGSKQSVLKSIASMGTNLVTVSITGDETIDLSQDDITSLKKQYSSIENLAPIITGSTTAKVGEESGTCTVYGTTSAFEDVKNLHPAYGRFITDIDNSSRFNVVDVGIEVLQTVYPDMSATQYESLIGTDILLNGTSFEIIGILESKGDSSASGTSDNIVVMPLKTAEQFLGTTSVSSYYAEASSESMIDQAVTDLTSYFLPLCDYSTDDFDVETQDDLISTSTETTDDLTMMLVGIAAISLIVGGIGIMNIMMVSVIERTREIGIRKAIGAKRRDIMIQFLIEAVFISCIGGILGVLLGIAICLIVPQVSDQAMVMSNSVMVMAFSFSAGVGIIFGAYPAAKASKMRPIDALRYE